MKAPISVKDKQDFIHWFLNHYDLIRIENVWMLNYFLSKRNILEHLHFVRDITNCPRGIVISTKCSNDDVDFLFIKQQVKTHDPDKAFHDIRLHQSEPIFVKLNFFNCNKSPIYASVLEENPYIAVDSLTSEGRAAVDQLLNNILVAEKIEKLKVAIDKALDERNHEKFIILTNKLLVIQSERNDER